MNMRTNSTESIAASGSQSIHDKDTGAAAKTSSHKGLTLTLAFKKGVDTLAQLLPWQDKPTPRAIGRQAPVPLTVKNYPSPLQDTAPATLIKVEIAKSENTPPSAVAGHGKTPAPVAAQKHADSVASPRIAKLAIPTPTLADIPEVPADAYTPSELNSPAYNAIMDSAFDARNALRSRFDGRFLNALGMPAGFHSPQLQKMHEGFEDEFEKACAKKYATARQDGDSVAQALATLESQVTSENMSICEKFAIFPDQAFKNYAKLMTGLLQGDNKTANGLHGGGKAAGEHIAAPIADASEENADTYRNAELQSPAFQKFQKQNAGARDALRCKHEKLFLARMKELAENESRLDKLETIVEKYEARFEQAFAKQYEAARKDGLSVPAALKLAGKLAGDDACAELLKSGDKSCMGYAKLMMQFRQNAVDQTLLSTGKAWTSITYERAATPRPQRPAPDTLQESMALFASLTPQPAQPSAPLEKQQAALKHQELLASLRADTKLPDAGTPWSISPLTAEQTAAPAAQESKQPVAAEQAVAANQMPEMPQAPAPQAIKPAASEKTRATQKKSSTTFGQKAKKAGRRTLRFLSSPLKSLKKLTRKMRRTHSYDFTKFDSKAATSVAAGNRNKVK